MKKIFFLLFPYLLSAHPHIFIDASVKFFTQNDSIHSFTMKWEFVEMNSAMMIMDYDINHDNHIDAKEQLAFKKDFFDKSKEGSYYTTVHCDKKRLDITDKIQNFHVSIIKQRFVVSFDVALPPSSQVTVGLWDQDNYTAFDIFNDAIKSDNAHIQTKVQEVETDFYFGYNVIAGSKL